MTPPFTSLDSFRAVLAAQPDVDTSARTAAAARNGQLTKPPGALGRLEDLAIWLAGWQGREKPKADAPQVVIFAGNHGVAARGVSAFPPEVTAQMVANFRHGGAAINQLSKAFGAAMTVHALDLDHPTADFTQSPAMTEAELTKALTTGWNAVDPQADLLVTGEMGIGNTTSAAAIVAALLGGAAEDWVGRGTGVDDHGLARKAAAVHAGLATHAALLSDPLQVLRCLGGHEIAAMAGAIARARAERIAVVLDGFICCAAALVLQRARSGALDHCLAGHVSAEAGHGRLLAALDKQPLLNLGLRLGEGSGAALALGIVQGAVACHSGMATFAEAGVSGA
ncbi:nicotinate-nucleotide--dimethylbenzimidazole phosphoribosyltransferase [Pseudotabrizicola sediminis]|uniref:Nicotinate-nucleotide--dimethylbenzimidazole phosphoribosyltransferase n=1 Tax=Pseudotabrizicola sediminis TaxID=2486418 RepID=A0ABY2KM43_9RHOB|nr:nicotinate-nucleotide--dimethylbenzimidazole phosphoribosyltransferase [Pseudotabrizicola sediminis]TGD43586.1 nicotinate-nucleotide--dimethylbenzimidazole phosphoribosyltransferase [Pseudotabrizicola sediminis]